MTFPEANLSRIKDYSVEERTSKVEIEKLAKVATPKARVSELLSSLPRILKGEDFNYLIDQIISAKKKKKGIIVMFGAHLVKCGLSPIMIDLMHRGFITHLATNGAGAIHDLELAFWGKTSEEVEAGLKSGRFGMAKETSQKYNQASSLAEKLGLGLGEALGKKIWQEKAPNRDLSILAAAYRHRIPTTVHVAFGTDVVHQHPSFRPKETGEASFKDFKILCRSVKSLANGGVALNLGSAVVMPEVFLKSLSVARNLYGRIDGFTTANFDMFWLYRPQMNVVRRPTLEKGRGLYFVGHHEIMIPLLAAGIKSRA